MQVIPFHLETIQYLDLMVRSITIHIVDISTELIIHETPSPLKRVIHYLYFTRLRWNMISNSRKHHTVFALIILTVLNRKSQ